MKKLLIFCIFALLSLGVGAGPLDFVVLLDISESMLPYFDDTINYLIGDLLKQHLVASDGFHLLTFANNPEIELIIDVEGVEEVNEALDRILLLQPLGKYTDLVSALKFVYSYTSSVRQDSTKKILVLTDGIHDPPPGTPYPVSENVYKEVAAEVAENIRKKGWDITLVQFPSGAAARAEAGVDAGETAERAEAGVDAGETSGSAAEVDSDAVAGEDSDTTGNGQDAESGGVDLYTELSGNLDVDVVAYDESDGENTHRALDAPEQVFPELNLLPVLGYTAGALGGIAVLTLFVFAVKGLIARTFAATGAPAARGSQGTIHERAIEMHVEGQNPNIGSRNVNYIRNNGRSTIGGGFSAFLIYIYKVPSRIGLISRKGENYTFKPLKPAYFENAKTVSDCLGKEITVLSENGRKIAIKFRRYVSALERINRIMRLVHDSGKTENERSSLE